MGITWPSFFSFIFFYESNGMEIICCIAGTAVLALLLAGYLGQRFLPPPKPKVVGIDLGMHIYFHIVKQCKYVMLYF